MQTFLHPRLYSLYPTTSSISRSPPSIRPSVHHIRITSPPPPPPISTMTGDHLLPHQDTTSPDTYARALARVAVAQLCLEALGLRRVHRSILDSLSDAAVKYVRDLGRSAKSHSETSHRSAPNSLDVLAALHDLSPSSAIIDDLVAYLDATGEVPFAWPIPRFPIRNDREALRSLPHGEHVPPWLPALPEPHTYTYSTDLVAVAAEGVFDRAEQARARRLAEKAFLGLERRLDDARRRGTGFGHRESPVTSRDLSLQPVIEAVRRRVCGTGDRWGCWNDELLPRKKRSGTKFGFDRWTLSPLAPLAPERGADWGVAAREQQRNEKKRKAATILKESVEKPHELYKH